MDISGWKSIDIYLFTNGQEQSPPRKYHLTDDELDMWDDTLSKLGGSQNGYINQPIEIYTLNGDKISSPMDLKNGGTYVAVNLGETFISARYKRYIMRATRSWEKRKVKKFIELPLTKTPEIQEEYGDLGKSSRKEVIINIQNLYKQNNSDFSPKNSGANKYPCETESQPSPHTCNIVDSTLRHSPWYDNVNIHKVQIEKGIFKNSIKKTRYKNSYSNVRSSKSIINSQESKQSPTRKPARGLPIKKKVVPKSTSSPINAAKRKKNLANTARKTIRPQMKDKNSTPSNRSVRSNDTKTSDTPTEVNKWRHDPSQFTSDSEQGKDQQKSAAVKEAAKETFSDNRLGKPPEPRQRWSLNDEVINRARNSRDQTPAPINRNLSNPVNDLVKPNTQPEGHTQKNYILLKPDNTAIIVDENVFKSMSPDELSQYISYGAINKITPLDTNENRVKDQPAEEPVTVALPPALPNDNPDDNKQRSASTSSRKSVNIDDTNIQHIPPSPKESIYNDEKSISPDPENGKEFSREQIHNSICIQTLAKNKPKLIEVAQGMCSSSSVQTFLPTMNMDLGGRSPYRQIPRNVDIPEVTICTDGDHPPNSLGSRYPKCSNLYNVTFNTSERDTPSKAIDEKMTVHGKNVSFPTHNRSMSPRNVNVNQPSYKNHTLKTHASNSPYKDNWFPKYSNKYDYIPPKVITRHIPLDISQIRLRETSKSADGRTTKRDRTFSSSSSNNEITKRLPQTQSPRRHGDISQLNARHTFSRYGSLNPLNDPGIQKFGSDADSTKSDGNRNQTIKSGLSQLRSSQSSQSMTEKRSPLQNNYTKSNNNEQRNRMPSYFPRDPSKSPIRIEAMNRNYYKTPIKENVQPNLSSNSTSPIKTRGPTKKSILTSPINRKSPNENLKNIPQVLPSSPSNAISGKSLSFDNLSPTSQRNRPPLDHTPRQYNNPQQRPKSPIPLGLVSSRYTYTSPENIPPNVKSASTSPVSTKTANEAKTKQTISDKRFPYRNNSSNLTNATHKYKLPSQINIPQQRLNSPVPLGSNRNAYKAPPMSTRRPNEASTNQFLSERKLLSTNNQQRNRIPLRQVNIPQQRPNSPVFEDHPKFLNTDYRNRLLENYPSGQMEKSYIKHKETADIRDHKSDFINKKSPSVKHNLVSTNQPRIKSIDNSQFSKISVDNTVSSNAIEELSPISQSSNYVDQSKSKTADKLDGFNNIDLNEKVASDMKPNLDRAESTMNLNNNVIKVDIPQAMQDNMSPDLSKETESFFDKTESLQTESPTIIIIQQDTFENAEKNYNNSDPFNNTVSNNQTTSEFADHSQLIVQPTVIKLQYSTDNNITDENKLKDLTTEDILPSENVKINDDMEIASKNAIEEQSNNIDNKILTELKLKNSDTVDTVVDTNRGDAFSENESVKRSSVESAGKYTPTINQPITNDAGAKNEITAVMGKGDIFNLKLNLNGKNVEGLITIDKANKNELPQKINLDQSSQTNLNIMFKEKPTNENSASDVSCSATESGNKMPNVIVVQCACCENINIEELKRKLPKAFDNYMGDTNKCIVFLPTDSKSTEKHRDALNPYSAYSDNGRKDFTEDCECLEIPENLGITQTGVHYPEDEVKLYQPYNDPEGGTKESLPATLNDNVVNIVPKCTDASTQTEWQDALLIPVIHEDGHITFKFPSLETVKNM